MDAAFVFLLLAVFSVFNCHLGALITSKMKTKDYFLGPALASKQALFRCLNLVIALKSAVLWLFLSQ
jgi:hypothetical protein